jgi:hypothetical protein
MVIQSDQKSLCAPDDYNTIVRFTGTFWSLCIFDSTLMERAANKFSYLLVQKQNQNWLENEADGD